MSKAPFESKLRYAWQRFADRNKDVIYSSHFRNNSALVPYSADRDILAPYHTSTWFKAVKQKDDQFVIYKCEYTKVHPGVIPPYKTQYTEDKIHDGALYSREWALTMLNLIEEQQKIWAAKPSRLLQRFIKPQQ